MIRILFIKFLLLFLLLISVEIVYAPETWSSKDVVFVLLEYRHACIKVTNEATGDRYEVVWRWRKAWRQLEK